MNAKKRDPAAITCPGCSQTGTLFWADGDQAPKAGQRRRLVRVSNGFHLRKPVGAPTGFGRAKNGIEPGHTRIVCDQCETVQNA